MSTPRTVAPRGDLSELERASIELFERVSPSVVQVVGRAGTIAPSPGEGEGQSGTGFVWDAAGHIVTNDHVVEGAGALAVRFESGRVLPARIVGTASDYDLAVLRVDDTRSLPPPIAIGTSADLKRGLSGLATIGATAPYVGLFGTTFGIINAFSGMALTGSGGIAAISAGIAEALITTAFGLFVAVPAVWAFNYFNGKVEAFNVEMDNSSSELLDYFIKKS